MKKSSSDLLKEDSFDTDYFIYLFKKNTTHANLGIFVMESSEKRVYSKKANEFKQSHQCTPVKVLFKVVIISKHNTLPLFFCPMNCQI